MILAFQADYPEACLLTLVRQNYACPICMVKKTNFANIQETFLERTVQEMSDIFHSAKDLERDGNLKCAEELLQSSGLVGMEVWAKIQMFIRDIDYLEYIFKIILSTSLSIRRTLYGISRDAIYMPP